MKPFVIAMVALLPGCTAGACDPAQAGFVSGIGCQASGAYGARSQSLQTQLSASRSAALQERAQAIEAQQDAAASQAALARRRERLRTIDAQNLTLQRRLAALAASNRADRTGVEKARADLADIDGRRAAFGASPDDTAIRDLQQQQDRLQKVVSSLGDL